MTLGKEISDPTVKKKKSQLNLFNFLIFLPPLQSAMSPSLEHVRRWPIANRRLRNNSQQRRKATKSIFLGLIVMVALQVWVWVTDCGIVGYSGGDLGWCWVDGSWQHKRQVTGVRKSWGWRFELPVAVICGVWWIMVAVVGGFWFQFG